MTFLKLKFFEEETCRNSDEKNPSCKHATFLIEKSLPSFPASPPPPPNLGGAANDSTKKVGTPTRRILLDNMQLF
ncbi:hypothetical protein CH376_16025 [Leptospira adleri]|uniref:SWIM-type domain-containing protein n=1 Tax=Leptospira adleri TaxID=2023186 RepID=A0ABX4NVV1_9LEPT|nr:hypothetical protein CH376_16025 [Leptospira adleri]